jgi:hypothetical protein
MHFTISRPQKRKKAQPDGEAASPAACTIGVNVTLDTQTRFFFYKKKLGFGLGQDLSIIGVST